VGTAEGDNFAKLIRRKRISLKRDNHPPKKTMVVRFEQKIDLEFKIKK
jgi:hypothetical protein